MPKLFLEPVERNVGSVRGSTVLLEPNSPKVIGVKCLHLRIKLGEDFHVAATVDSGSMAFFFKEEESNNAPNPYPTPNSYLFRM